MLVTLVPALFMTAVCSTYLFIAGEGLHLPPTLSYVLGGCTTLLVFVLFLFWRKRFEAGRSGEIR